MVTAEIAVALPAVVLVLTLALAAVGAVMDQVRCVDASRVGARLLARGEPPGEVRSVVAGQAPARSQVTFDVRVDSIRVEVRSELPGLLGALGVGDSPRGVAHAVPELTP